jgi:hypothetical protein
VRMTFEWRRWSFLCCLTCELSGRVEVGWLGRGPATVLQLPPARPRRTASERPLSSEGLGVIALGMDPEPVPALAIGSNLALE